MDYALREHAEPEDEDWKDAHTAQKHRQAGQEVQVAHHSQWANPSQWRGFRDWGEGLRAFPDDSQVALSLRINTGPHRSLIYQQVECPDTTSFL